ncbi:hypothetical protein TOC8171_42190 [Pseudomonas syringae]
MSVPKALKSSAARSCDRILGEKALIGALSEHFSLSLERIWILDLDIDLRGIEDFL